MKKFFLLSFFTSVILSFFCYIIWKYFTYIWLVSLLIGTFFFISNTALIFYIKKRTKQDIINLIYKKLNSLLPNNMHYQKQVNTVNDLEKIIENIQLERQKEQEHFKKINSYRKEFLGNVSHELKTPIFNIQGYVSTLLDGAMEEKELLVEYLKKTDKNIERMIGIIDDLETISQLESGSMILDYEVFAIDSLVDEVFEQMELFAQKKNIHLSMTKENQEYLFVNADKFRIRQVLLNLISNSVKYGKENGNVRVLLKKENEKVFVSVEDDGIGIEEKHLPRIFERFYRVDKGRSREQGGTGLGLAIVKHIIEAHKQNIFVKSQLNQGTVFTFSLESA